ncbi:MAG TPA: 16S rRNA (guanine(966)-N(2))-methyltransferase RsmD [Gammaproteobacteria bacterium]|nr:16S rRNA (guanine(966)-N(2))-methyltransferase RsmD [Gammaproteobacteria bacterium]
MSRGGAPRRLRIIGGRWRGRILRFAPVPGLRPTPDRVRETLFNWLQADLPGARCLDLFAGSGVLGFEALSRGAAAVTLVERDVRAVRVLRDQARMLEAEGAAIVRAVAQDFLRGAPRPFDIVFLDPPYAGQVLPRCIALLHRGAWLAPCAWVYLECSGRAPLPELPPPWRVYRSRRAGEVGYHLLRVTAEAEAS